MRACFADGVELPIECSIDLEQPYNCTEAMSGVQRNECPCWQPERAVKLALNIMGVKR